MTQDMSHLVVMMDLLYFCGGFYFGSNVPRVSPIAE